MHQKQEDKKYSKTYKNLLNKNGNIYFISCHNDFCGNYYFRYFNYLLNSQAKKVEKLKNAFTTVLNNTIGFIELEKKYCETISGNSEKTTEAIKKIQE